MDILPLLSCPETGQALREATPAELGRFTVSAGLVREDGRVLYPVENGIPLLVPSAGVRRQDPPQVQ